MKKDNTQAFGSIKGRERRREQRHDVKLNVNYSHGDTYLYSKSSNISEMGIFLVSDTPLAAGTVMKLKFTPPHGGTTVEVNGEVVWIDPGLGSSPGGMGIRFIDPDEETKNRIKSIIRTMAYLD